MKKKGKKGLWAVAIIAVILVAMALTSPSEEKHEQAIASAITANFDNVSAGFIHPNKKLISLALKPLVDVDNYGVVSIGRCPLIDRVVSVGVFGHVFTLSEDMLTDAIDEQINKLGLPDSWKEGLENLLPWN